MGRVWRRVTCNAVNNAVCRQELEDLVQNLAVSTNVFCAHTLPMTLIQKVVVMSAKRLRISYVTCYPASIMRGGLEIQAERTVRALSQIDDIEMVRFTPETEQLGDLVHFFGTFDYFWDIAEHCVRQGVPYVCSPVYLTGTSGFSMKLRRIRKRYIDRSYPRKLHKLYTQAKLLFANTEAEESNLRNFFGASVPPMVRTPNGIEERFFRATPDLFRSETGIAGPFVLHSGRLESRKNQLSLIQAMAGLDADLVLLGREADDEYVAKCRAASGPRVHYIGELDNNSPLIPSMNAAAALFCLPSFSEVLSLSAFEAAATGTPVILGNTWGAEEYFGSQARYVRPGSISEIRNAIQAALSEPQKRQERRSYFEERYSWTGVAQLMADNYRKVVG